MIPRPTFAFPAYAPSYFLGHMARSLRDLPKVLTDIDLIIEARDARLPLSGINGNFERVIKRAWGGLGTGIGEGGGAGWGGNRWTIGSGENDGARTENMSGTAESKIRERIVVYTKRDLGEGRYEEPLRKAFLEHAGQKVFFADTNVDKDVKHILKYAVQLAKENSAVMSEMKILVVGMPNVGKSSLLNALRRVGVHKGKAFRISAQPGYTRKLTGTVKIHADPDLYVYDTPGVMVPYMGKGEKGAEKALKFALTTGIKTGLFEEELVAEYLLYLLNLHHYDNYPADSIPSYQVALGLPPQPINSLPELLEALARRLGTLRKGGEADTDAALVYFLKAFREGKLGRMTMDELRLGKSSVLLYAGIAEESVMAETPEAPSSAEAVPEGDDFATSLPSLPSALNTPTSHSNKETTSANDAVSGHVSSPISLLSDISASITPDISVRRSIDAGVSAAVRTFLMEQARKLDQTEEMSQSQERKKELQVKKKEKEMKWKAKHPGLAAGVAGQAAGKGVGWSRGDMRMKAKSRRR